MGRMRGGRVWAVVVMVALMLAGCGDVGTPETGSKKLLVVVTTTQIRSMAEAVAGDTAQVRAILSPGADPHEFEPRPSDVAAIADSGVVLKNGIGLDDWVDDLMENAGGKQPLVTVSEGIALRRGGGGEGDDKEDGERGQDPHVWQSVSNAMTMTTNIRDAMIRVDGGNADAYRANAERYLGELRELDQYIMEQVKGLPEGNRKMVTNHDAFGYFIDRYGLTFVGSIIPSLSTEAQPSAQDVAALIQKIKGAGARAIFLESSINPSLAEQIGKDADVKVVDTLYGDTLGEAGSPGATYVGMMRYNADVIVGALR